MGVTNRKDKVVVPAPGQEKTAMVQPGIDLPKQSRPAVGKMPMKGIQNAKIKRTSKPKAKINATEAKPAVAGAEPGAATVDAPKRLDRSGRDVFSIDGPEWKKTLKKYGVADF